MTQQLINLDVADSGLGTNIRDGGDRINQNFTELYALQSDTVNAGAVSFTGSTEERINAAIVYAKSTGRARVYVPASMLPYNAALVTFDAAVQMVREGGDWSGNDVLAYGAKGDAIADDSVAIQRAINDAVTVGFGGRVFIPAGNYHFATGLTINGAVEVAGAGGPSDSDGGFGTVAQTSLVYTGASGVAITIVGDATQGLKNAHLRDFLLAGNSNADGGILVGSATAASMVNHSTIKNVTVSGFDKVGAYGFKFRRCITSDFENCLAIGCYDGFLIGSDSIVTTLGFYNCHGYSCDRNGFRWASGGQGWHLTFVGLVVESNNDAGLDLDGAQFCNFYDLYCEANNTVSGAAPVIVRGTSTPSFRVNFHHPYIQDPAGGDRAFDFANANQCLIFYPGLEWASTDWCAVTAATTNCTAITDYDLDPSSVTGNAVGRMQVLGRSSLLNAEPPTAWTPIDASGAGLTFTGVSAHYVREGKRVTAWFALTYPATADGLNAIIGGLPYTSANVQSTRAGASIGYKTEATFTNLLTAANGTTVQPLTATGAAIPNATLSGDQMYCKVEYYVA